MFNNKELHCVYNRKMLQYNSIENENENENENKNDFLDIKIIDPISAKINNSEITDEKAFYLKRFCNIELENKFKHNIDILEDNDVILLKASKCCKINKFPRKLKKLLLNEYNYNLDNLPENLDELGLNNSGNTGIMLQLRNNNAFNVNQGFMVQDNDDTEEEEKKIILPNNLKKLILLCKKKHNKRISGQY